MKEPTLFHQPSFIHTRQALEIIEQLAGLASPDLRTYYIEAVKIEN